MSPKSSQRYAACVLLLIVGACGETSAEKCDDLLSTICSRVVECVGGVTQQACLQEAQAAVSCGAVTDVTPNYDRCMDQLHGFTCSTLFPADSFVPPADCRDIFRTSAGGDVAGELGKMEAALVQSEW